MMNARMKIIALKMPTAQTQLGVLHASVKKVFMVLDQFASGNLLEPIEISHLTFFG